MAIDLNDPRLESELRNQEQEYDRLRTEGEEAPAKILSVADTGFRLQDGASLLELYVEVYPDELPLFNAVTRHAVPDDQRGKFTEGLTIFVKFDPHNPKDVAVDHTPVKTPAGEVECPYCGASQVLIEAEPNCIFCRMPLRK